MINLHRPLLQNSELKEVKKVIKSSWISSAGKNVKKFENNFSKFTGSNYAVSCINGTSALHLAILSCGIKKNTEILLPCVSFIATANVVIYHNCNPVFFDVDDNLNINIESVLDFLSTKTFIKKNKIYNKKTKKQISAIIIVHAFGSVCNIKKLKRICKKYKIVIIEDSAASLGSLFNYKKHTGTLGDVGCFSFNANKIITTGSGGMLITQNSKIANKAKHLSTQAKKNNYYFEHDEIGYNYRLPNILATIGICQLKRIKEILSKKKKINNFYKKVFMKNDFFKIISDDTNSNNWINILKIQSNKKGLIKELLIYLNKNHIEIKPIWKLLHTQKKFKKFQTYKINKAYNLINSYVCLPSGLDLNNHDLKKVYYYINNFKNNILNK